MDNLFKKHEAGRVVDLKRMREPENKVENTPIKKEKGGFFVFRFSFFRKPDKGHRVDFLKHYKHLEKKEDFVEEEILKEYLEEGDENKKQNILVSFFNFITRVLKLWWLPLFIIRFFWILFWRVSKLIFFPTFAKATVGKIPLIKASSVRAMKDKTEDKPIFAKATVDDVSGLRIFWQSLWSIPREVKNFLLGRTTEDYFYQRVLIDEMKKKKFKKSDR